MSVSAYRVDEERLDSFLMRLRLFYADEENIFIRKILGIVGREFTDDVVRANLKKSGEMTNSNGEHSLINFNIRGEILTADDIWSIT
jgi:hypothetical protein